MATIAVSTSTSNPPATTSELADPERDGVHVVAMPERRHRGSIVGQHRAKHRVRSRPAANLLAAAMPGPTTGPTTGPTAGPVSSSVSSSVIGSMPGAVAGAVAGALVLVGGAAVGVVTVLLTSVAAAAHAGSAPFVVSTLMLVSSWVNSFWAWAVFPFVIGWCLPRRRGLALGAATVGLLLAVGSYYVLESAMSGGPLEAAALLRWSVAAAVGAPVLAALGGRARRYDAAALLSALAAPAVMVWSAATRPAIWAPATDAARATVLTAALIMAALFIVRARRHQPASVHVPHYSPDRVAPRTSRPEPTRSRRCA